MSLTGVWNRYMFMIFNVWGQQETLTQTQFCVSRHVCVPYNFFFFFYRVRLGYYFQFFNIPIWSVALLSQGLVWVVCSCPKEPNLICLIYFFFFHLKSAMHVFREFMIKKLLVSISTVNGSSCLYEQFHICVNNSSNSKILCLSRIV